jgi:hypothetical protein
MKLLASGFHTVLPDRLAARIRVGPLHGRDTVDNLGVQKHVPPALFVMTVIVPTAEPAP